MVLAKEYTQRSIKLKKKKRMPPKRCTKYSPLIFDREAKVIQ